MSNVIRAGGLAVPDQALSPYAVHRHAEGVRAALPALEEGLGDEVAWRLYAAAASQKDEAELALLTATAVYGRHLRSRALRDRQPTHPTRAPAEYRTVETVQGTLFLGA